MDKRNKQTVLFEQLSTVVTAIPFNRMLGLHLNTMTADHVVMTFEMKPELIGNFLLGILHGGVISSVLDMTGGMVVMSASVYKNIEKSVEELVGTLGRTSTIDLHINYLSPGKGTVFTAQAWLTKSGAKISFARMELRNEDETLIATGSGTYLLK